MSIHGKIWLSITLCVGLIWWAVGVAVDAAGARLQDSIGTNSARMAHELLERVEDAVDARLEAIQKVAAYVSTHTLLIQSNHDFSQWVDVSEQILARDRQWQAVPDGNTTDFLESLTHNELADDLRVLLQGSVHGAEGRSASFAEVFLTNRYGANAAQTNRTSDYFQADERWWQMARANHVYISDMTYDDSAGVHALDMAVAVCDAQGRFMGVIKAVLSIHGISELVDTMRKDLSNDLSAMGLYDRNNKALHEITPAPGAEHIDLDADRLSLEGAPRGYFMSKASCETCPFLVAYARSTHHLNSRELGWTLIIQYCLSDIMVPVRGMWHYALAVLVGVSTYAAISEPAGADADHGRVISLGVRLSPTAATLYGGF